MPFCINCGLKLTDNMRFCPTCGVVSNENRESARVSTSEKAAKRGKLEKASEQVAQIVEERKQQGELTKSSEEIDRRKSLRNCQKGDSQKQASDRNQDVANTSGQGNMAVIPRELQGWNWGAFLLWWIWGIGNNTYISFLAIIPYVGWIIMPFVLGAKGNEWAWKNRRWESSEHFRMVQKQWALGGLIFVIVALVIYVIILSQV